MTNWLRCSRVKCLDINFLPTENISVQFPNLHCPDTQSKFLLLSIKFNEQRGERWGRGGSPQKDERKKNTEAEDILSTDHSVVRNVSQMTAKPSSSGSQVSWVNAEAAIKTPF